MSSIFRTVYLAKHLRRPRLQRPQDQLLHSRAHWSYRGSKIVANVESPDKEPQEERPICHNVGGLRVAGDGQKVRHLFQDGPEGYISTVSRSKISVQKSLLTVISSGREKIVTVSKCHSNRINFDIWKNISFGNCQNCHCNRGVTVTSVIISGEVCSRFTDLRAVWGGFEVESLCGSRIRTRSTLPPEMSGEFWSGAAMASNSVKHLEKCQI